MIRKLKVIIELEHLLNPQMPLALIDAYSLAYAAQLYEEMSSLKEEALALVTKLKVPSITKEVDECIRQIEDGKGITLVSWAFR